MVVLNAAPVEWISVSINVRSSVCPGCVDILIMFCDLNCFLDNIKNEI